MSKSKKNILEIIGTILLIIVGLVTIGLLFKALEEYTEGKASKKKDATPKLSKLDLKRAELRYIKNKIEELKPFRAQLRKREGRYFLWGRIGVGLIIISVNILVIWLNNWNWDLGFIININSTIILIYTFLGFVFYGNVTKLSRTVHIYVSKTARKKYISFLTELEEYESELPVLEEEIGMLEADEENKLVELKEEE